MDATADHAKTLLSRNEPFVRRPATRSCVPYEVLIAVQVQRLPASPDGSIVAKHVARGNSSNCITLGIAGIRSKSQPGFPLPKIRVLDLAETPSIGSVLPRI
jgi:hypothetical protein